MRKLLALLVAVGFVTAIGCGPAKPTTASKVSTGSPKPSPDKPKDMPPPADKPKDSPPPAEKPKDSPPPAEKPKDGPPEKPKDSPPPKP